MLRESKTDKSSFFHECVCILGIPKSTNNHYIYWALLCWALIFNFIIVFSPLKSRYYYAHLTMKKLTQQNLTAKKWCNHNSAIGYMTEKTVLAYGRRLIKWHRKIQSQELTLNFWCCRWFHMWGQTVSPSLRGLDEVMPNICLAQN